MFDQQYLSDTLKFKMAAFERFWSLKWPSKTKHPHLQGQEFKVFFFKKWILDVDVDRVMQN